jgi:TIGR03009 family protein
MRNAGWTLTVLLVFVSVANAQPGLPVNPTSSNSPEADSKLKGHLDAWEKAMDKVANMRADISLKRENAVFKTTKEYIGVMLIMKPNFVILRLDNAGDPTKQDYEAIISDGKSIYYYNGLEKTVTKWKLQTPTNNSTSKDYTSLEIFLLGLLPQIITQQALLLSGTNPKDLRHRFDISLFS